MTTTHPVRRLLAYAGKYRRDFRLATLYSVLNKFFDILPEVLIGAAVDVVVKGDQSFLARNVLGGLGITSTWHQLLALGVFNVFVWGGESLFQYLYELKWRRLAQDIQHELRLDTYRHVQKLEMAYFEDQRTGNLMAILNDDINQMERFLNGGANQIIQVFCSSLMISGVFLALQPGIALIALLPVPIILFGAFWFQNRLGPRYARVREAAGDVGARLNNNLLGLATIKAFATEGFEARRLPRGQCGGHPLQRGYHPGDPHGHPGRLYRHAAVWWLAHLAGYAGCRSLFGAGVLDATPVVAVDRTGRGGGYVPALRGGD
jgi:ATP-binding cassette subfamily B protein